MDILPMDSIYEISTYLDTPMDTISWSLTSKSFNECLLSDSIWHTIISNINDKKINDIILANPNNDKYNHYKIYNKLNKDLEVIRNELKYNEESDIYYCTTIDGSYCELTSIPAEIGSLTNLQQLWLYNNALTSIPAEIGSLTNLQELSLSDNKLTCIPAEIGLLTNLQYLWFSYNALTKIPAEIGLLTNLQQLWLSNCTYLIIS